MREAFLQTFENLRAQQAAQLPHDVRHPLGHDLGRHPVGDGRGLPPAATSTCCASSARTSASSGAAARACRPAASARAVASALTVDDARAIAAESSLVARRQAGTAARRIDHVKSAYNAGAPQRHGIEPQYQDIRTIDLEQGRQLNWDDERQVARASRSSATTSVEQLFGKRDRIGEADHAQRHPLHGRRQDPEEGSGQQLQRSRQRQDLRAVRGDGARTFRGRTRSAGRRVEHHRRAEAVGRGRAAAACWTSGPAAIEDIDWPLEQDVRAVARAPTRVRSRRHAKRSGCGTRR